MQDGERELSEEGAARDGKVEEAIVPLVNELTGDDGIYEVRFSRAGLCF